MGEFSDKLNAANDELDEQDSEMTHAASFDIKTPGDFFHMVVVPQYDDFRANRSSSRHALLAIIVAYHMYDWVHEKDFSDETKSFTESFQKAYPQDLELADVFDLARKITNGTKHFLPSEEKLKRPGFSPAKTRAQRGFSPGFNDSFARRELMVEVSDGIEKSADWLLGEMVDFWKRQEKADALKRV